MSLPPEVRAHYITIIDSILAVSDLTVISEKRIRKGIQAVVEYDITPQKAAIKELILGRFDVFNARQSESSHPIQSIEPSDQVPDGNGSTQPSQTSRTSPPRSNTPSKREAESEAVSETIDAVPLKKKRKTNIDEDAAFAAKLQAEEDKLARSTRGRATRKNAPIKKKKAPKKTSQRVKPSDDSDVDGSDAVVKKPHRDTGFHKPLYLSPALSSLFDGETTLSRPQTTKRIWQYIKANDLQDPADKRFIICDAKLRDVFRQEKVHMFTMTKLLNQQLYSMDE